MGSTYTVFAFGPHDGNDAPSYYLEVYAGADPFQALMHMSQWKAKCGCVKLEWR